MYGVEASDSSQKSWAVITGGSDGIGFAMAKDLAVNSGFNICIISRNEEKMMVKLEEIRELCDNKIQTKYVVADFEKMLTIENYQKIIGEPLKDLDIGFLALNAGWAQMGPFSWVSEEEV